MNTCTTCECIDNKLCRMYNKVVNTSLHKACSFFGHREIELTKTQLFRLKQLIEVLIVEYKIDTFYFGGLSLFDETCYFITSELKKKYPCINRIFCLYNPQHVREHKRPQWLKDLHFEKVVYLPLEFDWWYNRIYYRNLEIINRSDVVVFLAYANERSGAYKAYCYARNKKKIIYNLAEEKCKQKEQE